MISPVSSTYASSADQPSEAVQATPRPAQAQSRAEQAPAPPQDTVTLSRAARQGAAAQQGVAPKGTGDIDHDGDNG